VSEGVDLGVVYRVAREAVTQLVRTLSPEQLQTSVPACPGWTVHDVVSHLTGAATDVVNGRLRDGGDEQQSAPQVVERAETPTLVVLREWERSASQVEVVLSRSGVSDLTPVFDVAVHEHDIRGALDLPDNRGGELVGLAVEHTARLLLSKVESAGLDPVVIVDDAESVVFGDGASAVTIRMSLFEFFRAAFGRRSRAQIERRVHGTNQPGAYVPLICLSAPAGADIIE
jgi:uncharacterized protein (TIGR03083 family)